MDTNVAILTTNDSYREEITQTIRLAGGSCDICSTIVELEEVLRLKPHQGLIVDVLTKNKTGDQEAQKRLLDLMEIYPTAQIKWDPNNQLIRTILMVQNNGEESIDYFVRNVCKNAKLRTLRTNRRFDCHFNVLLLTDPDRPELAVRSATVNISRGGCYCVCFTPFPVKSELWIVINELHDQRPIKAETIWTISWGEKMKIPGNGLRFTEITEQQEHEFSTYMV